MKFAKNIWLAAALSVGYAMPVMADCNYPAKPTDPPNGATATLTEMQAGVKTTKQYSADMDAYLTCLDKETAAKVSALGTDAKPEAIQRVKQPLDIKHDAAVDELKKYVDEFNVQLRAYKAAKDAK